MLFDWYHLSCETKFPYNVVKDDIFPFLQFQKLYLSQLKCFKFHFNVLDITITTITEKLIPPASFGVM